MSTTQATQSNYRNFGSVSKKNASTTFQVGDFLTINAAGFLVPATVAGSVVGISNEEILTTTANYATTDFLNFTAKADGVRFNVPVIAGVPAQTQVGETFDVSATDARGIDLTAQVNNVLRVTKIVDSSTVEVEIV